MKASAVEPSEAHAAIALGKGFAVTTGFFPERPDRDQSFDLIVFNDVFEHLPSPTVAIAACEGMLRPGGLLVINLPSSSGTLYTIARLLNALGSPSTLVRMWQKDFSSPHISYFNPRTLGALVERCTSLRQVDLFRLDTLVAQGLFARIRSSHSAAPAAIMWLALRLLIPLLRLLPPDIVVGVYRRPLGK
jgi:2-polyprenyl-3-methyl-5-hydroxy-6-metoxy-1,4-benzoquinol methylase